MKKNSMRSCHFKTNANPMGFAQLPLFLGIFLIALSSPSCKKTSPHSQSLSPATAENTLKIGEVGSMTGGDATFGTSTHQGAMLAIEEANLNGGVFGRKLELVSLDDQGKASEAVLAVNKLITQERVHAVLGEVSSSRSLAMAPIAQQFKIPMITPSSINSKVTQQGDYIFRVCFVDQFQSKVMADFAWNNLRAKRAAILRDVKSDYSQDSSEIFIERFKKAGGSIVVDQSYSAGDIDFKSQLTAIRSAQPDVILVPGYYTEVALIARQGRELGITAPLLGGDGWDSPLLKEIGGKALQGSYFVSHFAQDPSNVENQKFVETYKKTYRGQTPDGLAALGYDAARVLIESLKRIQAEHKDLPQDLPKQIRDALATTRNFPGVTGQISIDAQRNAVKAAVVFQISDQGPNRVAATLKPEN